MVHPDRTRASVALHADEIVVADRAKVLVFHLASKRIDQFLAARQRLVLVHRKRHANRIVARRRAQASRMAT